MAALLTYYSNVDVEASAIQAAVLEEVTYTKVMRTGGEQALEKGKQGWNWLADRVGVRARLETVPPKTTADRVMDRAGYWQGRSKQTVQQAVLKLLSERLQVDAANVDLMSTRLIEEAAAGYGISTDLLLSQQAEAVATKYMEDCIEGIRDHLKKQGEDEIRATERVIADQLATMSASEKLEMQRALNLQALSASSLRSVFLKSGVPIAGIAALQAGGFGTYLALTTVMHAVFTSMLGITLPFAAYTTATGALSVMTGPIGVMFSLSLGVLGYFWGRRKIERSQFAMIVFTCVGHAGCSLIPATASLPSAKKYLLLTDGTNQVASSPEVEEEDFVVMERERHGRNLAASALDRAQSGSREATGRIETLQSRLRRAEELLASATANRSDNSTLQGALESVVQGQQRTISQLQDELRKALDGASTAKAKLVNQERETLEAEARYVSRLERRSKELRELWEIHYPRIDFSQQPVRWSAEQDFKGRIEIERALKELAEADDPVTLSRSRMHATHEHHSRFTIPNGVECRIFYAVKGGRIQIKRMCLKKDC